MHSGVEILPDGKIGGFVTGSFKFWLANLEVGNWSDSSVLNGSYNWIKDFIADGACRTNQKLFDLDKARVCFVLRDCYIHEGSALDGPNFETYRQNSIVRKYMTV